MFWWIACRDPGLDKKNSSTSIFCDGVPQRLWSKEIGKNRKLSHRPARGIESRFWGEFLETYGRLRFHQGPRQSALWYHWTQKSAFPSITSFVASAKFSRRNEIHHRYAFGIRQIIYFAYLIERFLFFSARLSSQSDWVLDPLMADLSPCHILYSQPLIS